MRRDLSSVFLLFALVTPLASSGCDDEPDAEEPSSSTPPVEEAHVSVHEWGLVAHHMRQGPTEMAEVVSGGARFAHAPVGGLGLRGVGAGGKPVLYVHTNVETALSVTIRAPGGTLVEHLPPATTTADSVTWSSLTVTPTSCPTSTRVTPDDPRCDTVDDYCKALENPDYDTNDASCLTSSSGARDNHLFYRAGVRIDALPLVVTLPDPNNPGWDVRNASEHPVPGKLMIVWRAASSGPPKVALVDPPAPGATLALPIDAPVLAESQCTATLRRMLVENGLTADETNAFVRAWDESIFGHVAHPGEIPPHRQPPVALQQTLIAMYYFAPREALDRMLPLEVTPAPESIVRAMLVKVDLFEPPHGTIGLGSIGTIGRPGPRPSEWARSRERTEQVARPARRCGTLDGRAHPRCRRPRVRARGLRSRVRRRRTGEWR